MNENLDEITDGDEVVFDEWKRIDECENSECVL